MGSSLYWGSLLRCLFWPCRGILENLRRDPNVENYPYPFRIALVEFYLRVLGFRVLGFRVLGLRA